jgi:hypothetical protein
LYASAIVAHVTGVTDARDEIELALQSSVTPLKIR